MIVKTVKCATVHTHRYRTGTIYRRLRTITLSTKRDALCILLMLTVLSHRHAYTLCLNVFVMATIETDVLYYPLTVIWHANIAPIQRKTVFMTWTSLCIYGFEPSN